MSVLKNKTSAQDEKTMTTFGSNYTPSSVQRLTANKKCKTMPFPCSLFMPLSCLPLDVLVILPCLNAKWKQIWTAMKSYPITQISSALWNPFIPDHYDSVFLSVSIVISFLPAAALESPMLALSTAQPAQSHGVQAKEEINRENIAAGSHIFILLWTSQL